MPEPLLLVDVDGVISLYGFDSSDPPAGHFEWVDGIAHYLSASAGAHLRRLSSRFELAWCTGWEEKANEYLPRALALPGALPYVQFDPVPRLVEAHWKLAAIDLYAGASRPVAWIDDAHDERCQEWAAARPGETLLVRTDPAVGITGEHAEQLLAWAEELNGAARVS